MDTYSYLCFRFPLSPTTPFVFCTPSGSFDCRRAWTPPRAARTRRGPLDARGGGSSVAKRWP